jgi:hypothetical protein
MAGRQAFWIGVFVGSEEGVDRARGAVSRIWSGMRENDHGEVEGASKDFVSTVFAGLGTAGLFSAWHRFPIPTAARLAKTGAKVGLAFGVLQDLTLGYVDFVKKHVFGTSQKAEKHVAASAT